VSTYVIAEAGSCGDADLGKMLRLVKNAYDAKANAVKFQWTSNGEKMAEHRGSIGAFSYAPVYEKYLQWPSEWHSVLYESCRELELDYMCTVYLPEDIKVVEPFVSSFKVSSFEMTDDRFIRAHAQYLSEKDKREIFISTGMSTTSMLEQLVKRTLCHLPNDKWRLMHCVSAYPAPLNELNLRAIHASWFTDAPLTGFSDHTPPQVIGSGGIAAAAGASIIEAHLKHNETDKKNPDEPHAMNVDQFKKYVAFIRETDVVLGSELKRQQECEKEMLKYQVQ
jgi:N,N'-diacetyllegionaminate synthase